MKSEYLTFSPARTKKIGEILAKKILSSRKRKAQILGLTGDLGGGKTTFLQGFAKGLGIKRKILSPTFVIYRKYEIKKTKGNFYHFDCYRILKPKEILNLGFKKIISDPKNIVAVEWADRIKKIMPQNQTVWVDFEFIDQKTRKIKISKIGNKQ